MPLSYPGKSIPNPAGFSLMGVDVDTAGAVVVKASSAAIEKYGLAVVQERASRKYDAGEIDESGAVQIHISDCE